MVVSNVNASEGPVSCERHCDIQQLAVIDNLSPRVRIHMVQITVSPYHCVEVKPSVAEETILGRRTLRNVFLIVVVGSQVHRDQTNQFKK